MNDQADRREIVVGDLPDYLRRAASAVYIAMDKVAADDLSPRLLEAANLLDRLTADRTTSASASASFTITVTAGQQLEVVHSSRAGLLDGTPNSVRVATRFDFTPTPTTTAPQPTLPPSTIPATTIPSSVPITVPPVPTTVAATTTTVETGPPPVSTVVVTPPRPTIPPAATQTPPAPVYELPDTGRPTDRQIAVSLLPLLTGLLLALATRQVTR